MPELFSYSPAFQIKILTGNRLIFAVSALKAAFSALHFSLRGLVGALEEFPAPSASVQSLVERLAGCLEISGFGRDHVVPGGVRIGAWHRSDLHQQTSRTSFFREQIAEGLQISRCQPFLSASRNFPPEGRASARILK